LPDSLVVDLDSLGSTASSLKTLSDAFSSSNDDADSVKPYLGSGELSSAVHDFAHDWKDKKKALISKLDSLQQMAEQGHEAYSSADGKLASGLTKQAG
jgi:hypothetical protein